MASDSNWNGIGKKQNSKLLKKPMIRKYVQNSNFFYLIRLTKKNLTFQNLRLYSHLKEIAAVTRQKPSFLSALVFTLFIAACTRPPELIGIDNPEIPIASQPDIRKHKVFLATTRQASDRAGVFYSGERASKIGLASVEVTIPPTHVLGHLERPNKLPPDPLTEFTISNPAVYSQDSAFISDINRELAKRRPQNRNVLFFVHGYNNTTTDGLLRLAQIVEDTGFEGVPVLMSWASAAKPQSYVYDLNSALVARIKLKEIGAILQKTNANRFDIFAHSMGTLLTMEGLVDATLSGRLQNLSKVGNIVLASPDIDLDLFEVQLDILPDALSSKIFILTSADDSTLRASRIVAGHVPRVGATKGEELEKLGVVTIDLSDISDSKSGNHSKFAGSPKVVQLIGQGLNSTGRFGRSKAPDLESLLANTQIRVFD